MGKTNWQILQGRRPKDDPQYRDVHNQQQLERGDPRKKQSMTSRMVLVVALSLLAAFVVYAVWASLASAKEASTVRNALKQRESAVSTIEEYEEYLLHADEVPEEDTSQSKYSDYNMQRRRMEASAPTEAMYTVAAMSEREVAEKVAPGTLAARYADGQWRVDWSPHGSGHVMWSLLAGAVLYFVLYEFMKRNLAAQNALADPIEVNDHKGDGHIQLPEEVMRTYNFFPDAACTSSVSPTSLISHVMLENKGIRPVEVVRRYREDVLDPEGNVVCLKGEAVCDGGGNPKLDRLPMFDKAFGDELYDASFLEKGAFPELRHWYDPRGVVYNRGNSNRDKLDYERLSDLINGDWKLPAYETQRPAGAYVVDTSPVNTMLLNCY